MNENEKIIKWIEEKLGEEKNGDELVSKFNDFYSNEKLKNKLCENIKKLLNNNINENTVKGGVKVGLGGIGNIKNAKYFIPGTFPGTATLMTSNKNSVVYYMSYRNAFWHTILKNLLPTFELTEDAHPGIDKLLDEIIELMGTIRNIYNNYNEKISEIVGDDEIEIKKGKKIQKVKSKRENYFTIRNWFESKNKLEKTEYIDELFGEIENNEELMKKLEKLHKKENSFCKKLGVYLGDRVLVAFCPTSSLDTDRYPILFYNLLNFIDNKEAQNRKILLNGKIINKMSNLLFNKHLITSEKRLTKEEKEYIIPLFSSVSSTLTSELVEQRGKALNCDEKKLKEICDGLKEMENEEVKKKNKKNKR